MNEQLETKITGSEPVDELVTRYPQLSAWLRDRGLGCYQCGEVFWGPLIDLYKTKKRSIDGFEELVTELNTFINLNK